MSPTVQIDSDPYIRHSLHTSMFFPSTRLFVAGNPKAAGTTLRWWLLAAHGADVRARTAESWWGESALFQTVWDQGIDLEFAWADLAMEQRDDALTSTDLLTVQPVRHPLSRLFSAWSGKYLIGEPYYAERLPEGFLAVDVPHINETVVPYRAGLVTDQTFDLVVSMYAADFERWQYERVRPKSSSRSVDLDWLNDVRGRNARYGVLHRALVHQRHENTQLLGEVAHLKNREHELLDSTSWRVTGPLRWVGDKAKR